MVLGGGVRVDGRLKRMFKFMLGFAGTGAAGTLAGVGARAIYWHLMGVSVIDEQTLMPVGVVVGVGTTILVAGWSAGRMVKGFQDRIEELSRRLDNLYCVRENECRKAEKKGKV